MNGELFRAVPNQRLDALSWPDRGTLFLDEVRRKYPAGCQPKRYAFAGAEFERWARQSPRSEWLAVVSATTGLSKLVAERRVSQRSNYR